MRRSLTPLQKRVRAVYIATAVAGQFIQECVALL